MRIVILTSSVFSETACAMAVRLSEAGYPPVGALALSSLNRGTLLRKLGQWGTREVVRYARAKIAPQHGEMRKLHNPYLESLLTRQENIFRSLREVGVHYGFQVATCSNQNSPEAVARLKQWSPDLIVFAGGNILRRQVLEVPRLGVLNMHLGMLPEVRGMSSPEWSLLRNVPVGVTFHYIDAGIDTGPVLQKYEYADAATSESLGDLRNRLIAFGIEKLSEVVSALGQGSIGAVPQSNLDIDRQYFVMHEWLEARAAERLSRRGTPSLAGARHG